MTPVSTTLILHYAAASFISVMDGQGIFGVLIAVQFLE
jgi:hypothetical protein